MSLGNRGGRPPKPTALHKLHGTKPERSRKAEPQPLGDLTDAPEWFTASERDGWDYAIKHSPPGLLKRIDRGILVLWVGAEDRNRRAMMAQDKIDENATAPMLVKGPDGLMISPYIEIIDRASKIMFRAADAMGFSPVARPRLKVEAPAGKDDKANPWATLRMIPGGKTG